MGTVLEFRTDVSHRDAGEKLIDVSGNQGHMCEIIIFPGVRIERHHDDKNSDIHQENLTDQIDEESYN